MGGARLYRAALALRSGRCRSAGARHQEPAHITIFIRTLLSLDIILRNVEFVFEFSS